MLKGQTLQIRLAHLPRATKPKATKPASSRAGWGLRFLGVGFLGFGVWGLVSWLLQATIVVQTPPMSRLKTQFLLVSDHLEPKGGKSTQVQLVEAKASNQNLRSINFRGIKAHYSHDPSRLTNLTHQVLGSFSIVNKTNCYLVNVFFFSKLSLKKQKSPKGNPKRPKKSPQTNKTKTNKQNKKTKEKKTPQTNPNPPKRASLFPSFPHLWQLMLCDHTPEKADLTENS